MKKILLMGIASAAVLATVSAKAMTLAEAGAKVSDAAENPSVMASVMSQLSAGDQTKFVAAVNEAIESMPVSVNEKTAKYLAANETALRTAKNLKGVLAETYATVSLEALTIMNEDFSTNLFSRTADAANPVSDAAMQKIATEAVKAVEARTAQSDVSNADQRNAFAALTFIRASNGTPEGLRESLLAGLPAAAGSDWIPAAMGEGEAKTYDSMLGIGAETPDADAVAAILADMGYRSSSTESDASTSSDAGTPGTIMPMAPDVLSGSILGDIVGSGDSAGGSSTPFTDALLDPTQYGLPQGMENTGLQRRPQTLNPDKPWYNGENRDNAPSGEEEEHKEPGGYWTQLV